MELYYWPSVQDADAEVYELQTLGDLHTFVREHESPDPTAKNQHFIRELSANNERDGTPYLVLAWVEITSD